ncbi:MAG TPA: hypothetical protein PKN32_10890 [Bacteroidales bacterium]|nr:hypothetical protein [Bacteroidales bacterium]
MTDKLDEFYDIIYISKLKKINLKNFKQDGNSVATKYNDIFYSTKSEYIYIICSSDLNRAVINRLISYKESDKDFDLFLLKKTNNLITLLSGLVIKKEVLIKIGFLEKHIFNDLYFNLLFNYSRFIVKIPNNFFSNFRMNCCDLYNYFYWNQYEKYYYMNNPIYKYDYMSLYKEFDFYFTNNVFKKILQFVIRKKMDRQSDKIKDRVCSVSFFEY